MDIFSVLNMLGGLALFLYGMNAMGDGLAKVSGGRLESVLEKLTKKRIMAVLLGAAVTAVIQSSSATTVMVVGFVNSGIMKLGQAIGIIMGANIGTTITSWILALTGIAVEAKFFFTYTCGYRLVLHIIFQEGQEKEYRNYFSRLCHTHVRNGDDERSS